MLLLPALVALAAATPPAVPDDAIRTATDRLAVRLVETRRDLHAHPELSNREVRTGKLVAERLRALGLEVRFPVARTGVIAVLRGGRPGRTVALRADMDALPIVEKSDVAYRSQVDGVMHACGHDAHTAILLAVAEVLTGLRSSLPGTVVFLFQPAEEGAPEGEDGGAPLMIREGALSDPRVEAIFGLHVGMDLEMGTVGWAAGPLLASSDTFTIEVEGKRAHGAQPHKGLDPVPIAAEMIQALQLIVSRQTEAQSPKVLTIGQIHGGSRFNIIADRVTMDGTLRTFDATLRSSIKERMARTVRGVAEANGTTATLRFIDAGNAPTVNDVALTRAALPVLERVFGQGRSVEMRPQMVAEDFSAYAERVPGFFFFLGTANAAKGIQSTNHTDHFDVDEAALPLGVRALATLAWEFLSRPAARSR